MRAFTIWRSRVGMALRAVRRASAARWAVLRMPRAIPPAASLRSPRMARSAVPTAAAPRASRMRNARRSRERGVMLLEVMLAVMIFSIGVITLGRCVSYCIAAERLKEEHALARRALENRWAEIESGATPGPEAGIRINSSEDLKGPFAGMTMKMASVPVLKKNEKEEKIEGISAVTLTVIWQSGGEEQSKELIFYVYPRQK